MLLTTSYAFNLSTIEEQTPFLKLKPLRLTTTPLKKTVIQEESQEINDDTFSDDFYENIEKFLDEQDLFIVDSDTSSSSTEITLKSPVSSNVIKRMSLLCSGTTSNLFASESEPLDLNVDLKAVPSFFARRAASFGATSQ